MNGCYYYLLLVGLLSSLERTFSINLPNVTIQHLCEDDLLTIECPQINDTIHIVRSMYGRTSQRLCNADSTNPVYYKTCANIEQSKAQLKLRCHGKSSCRLRISNEIFTDPCGPSVPKHFEMHYRCLNTYELCQQSLWNCSRLQDLSCVDKLREDYACQCPSTICQYNGENRLIGFVEQSCSAETFQGIHWPKTLVSKGQHVPCPYPCTGQIFRFCQVDRQWSKANYTSCQCPTDKITRIATHYFAPSYVFQCHSWLINRLLPTDNPCILSFFNHTQENDDGSATCLRRAFEHMSWTSCFSFSFEFKNLGFEIFLPTSTPSRVRLPTIASNSLSIWGSNRILVDRFALKASGESSTLQSPMMLIDTKSVQPNSKSVILVEQSNHLSSKQTANVTVIFHHPSSERRYQCRAYRSRNSSFELDSTDIFFACQLLCSNGSHVICQCPFFNPLMHYVLHLDTSVPPDDFDLLMMENDFQEKCSIDSVNRSLETSMTKIDRYLQKVSSVHQKKSFAKKLLSFFDQLIDRDDFWIKENFSSNYQRTIRLIDQLDRLGSQLIEKVKAFTSIHRHLEFFVNAPQLENSDRSVRITIDQRGTSSFVVLHQFDRYLNATATINSPLVHWNVQSKDRLSFHRIEIEFRHLTPLNTTHQRSSCVYLKSSTDINRSWGTDGCVLLASNTTHSICSCHHLSTYALLVDSQPMPEKSTITIHASRLAMLGKIGCLVSLICLLMTMITLVLIRRCINLDDDLLIIRNILHLNMCICLFLTQCLFLLGIDQISYKFACRTISILLHYFLLASLSWMFVDGIELIIALKYTFKLDRIRLWAYAFYAYGFPLLIVILSMTLSPTGDFTSTFCWLSHDYGFLWAFAIPFVLLICANVGFFLLSLCASCTHVPNDTEMKETRSSLRHLSLFSVFFGLIWFTGLFFFHEHNGLVFSYVLTILNSYQGIFIWLFYCLGQKPIQNFYLHRCFYSFKSTKQVNPKHEKSAQHYNTSSSGYSSTQSSDLNKQILTIDFHPTGSFPSNSEYLSSLPNHMSTFRYASSSKITLPMTSEHNEQLLKKYQLDLHQHTDDHQYYEIG